MAKQRPHTIILTEMVQRNTTFGEVEIALPVATIRKLITDTRVFWERTDKGDFPHQEKVTIIQRTGKEDSTLIVKESVRQITDLLNGPATKLTHGSNADCPDVKSGATTRCQGHQS